MRKLAVLVVAVVALLVVGDLVARGYAERNIERAVEARSEQIAHVNASIESFPFAGRLLVTGEVPHLVVTATGLRGTGADLLESLRLDVHGLEIDRGVLIDDGRVRVTGVDRVRVRAVLDGDLVAARASGAGIDVVVVDDGVEVSGLGRTERATVEVAGDFVVLTAGDLPPLSIPVPPVAFIPCPVAVEVVDGDLVVTCETDMLPAVVLEAIG
ncbi:MAG: LmeA family phospholipid-binding protein [Acidimicrobiales bacterium]